MFINRVITPKLVSLAKLYPVLSVNGPRQSGKTTLVKEAFPHLPYVSLENFDTRQTAIEDPRKFLELFPGGVILDEAQHAPQLFSYIQTVVDTRKHPCQFILTGSQNFLLMEKITQSLSGRIAVLDLLPLSIAELKNNLSQASIEELLFKGFFPGLYKDPIDPRDFFTHYVRTYVERDVRMIKNILDLSTFQKFLKMCAARIGGILNLSSLANDCGITHNTAKAWISLLEASYIVFLVRPHHANFSKRLIKAPKLYFYDTGLACHLLEIETSRQLATHAALGGIFESMVFSELAKHRHNQGLRPNLYFWRDSTGHEVDCILETPQGMIPLEIKAGKTVNNDFFKGIAYWQNLAARRGLNGYVLYAGTEIHPRKEATALPWDALKEPLRLLPA